MPLCKKRYSCTALLVCLHLLGAVAQRVDNGLLIIQVADEVQPLPGISALEVIVETRTVVAAILDGSSVDDKVLELQRSPGVELVTADTHVQLDADLAPTNVLPESADAILGLQRLQQARGQVTCQVQTFAPQEHSGTAPPLRRRLQQDNRTGDWATFCCGNGRKLLQESPSPEEERSANWATFCCGNGRKLRGLPTELQASASRSLLQESPSPEPDRSGEWASFCCGNGRRLLEADYSALETGELTVEGSVQRFCRPPVNSNGFATLANTLACVSWCSKQF